VPIQRWTRDAGSNWYVYVTSDGHTNEPLPWHQWSGETVSASRSRCTIVVSTETFTQYRERRRSRHATKDRHLLRSPFSESLPPDTMRSIAAAIVRITTSVPSAVRSRCRWRSGLHPALGLVNSEACNWERRCVPALWLEHHSMASSLGSCGCHWGLSEHTTCISASREARAAAAGGGVSETQGVRFVDASPPEPHPCYCTFALDGRPLSAIYYMEQSLGWSGTAQKGARRAGPMAETLVSSDTISTKCSRPIGIADRPRASSGLSWPSLPQSTPR
jgi:hypothetical protein